MTGRGRPWTDKEIERLLILRNEGLAFCQIAKKLGRPISSTKGKYHNIKNVKVSDNPKRDWSSEEIELLVALSETLPRTKLLIAYNNAAVSNGFIKRSIPSIRKQLHKLGQSMKPQMGWYTIESISIGLGFSRHKVKSWVNTGKIKTHNEGKHTYIRTSDLIKFIVDHPTCILNICEDGLQWFLALLKEEREAK